MTDKKDEKKKPKLAKVESLLRALDKTDDFTTLRRICHEIKLGNMEHRYCVMESDNGIRILHRINGSNEAYLVDDEALLSDVIRFMDEEIDIKKGLRLAKQAVEMFKLTSDPIVEPEFVAFKSDPKICYRKLDFDPSASAFYPYWDEILERMTNRLAFQCWIGSLFIMESSRHQYVWMAGEGRDSKSTIMSWIDWVFGPSYGTLEVPHGNDQFWNACLVGKRVGGFVDVGSSRFPISPKFKMVTGNDAILINQKMMKRYKYIPKTKFIFGSNNEPAISRTRADRRRIIFCEFKTFAGTDDPLIVEKLKAESPGFIHDCIALYHEHCPNNISIPVDEDATLSLIERNEEAFDRRFDEFFELGDTVDHKFSGENLAGFFEYCRFDLRTQTAFRKYMKSKHEVVRKTTRPDNKKYYVGAKVKKIYW